jgi:serine protease Do
MMKKVLTILLSALLLVLPVFSATSLDREVVEEVEKQTVAVVVPGGGLGTGTVVTEDGYILTCAHVAIAGRDNFVYVLGDDRNLTQYKAAIVFEIEIFDLAILKINVDKPLEHVATMAEEELESGDVVFTVGMPYGLAWSTSAGITSAKRYFSETGVGIYQTDIVLNPGNSGGGLFTEDGKYTGICSFIYSTGLSFAYIVNKAVWTGVQGIIAVHRYIMGNLSR